MVPKPILISGLVITLLVGVYFYQRKSTSDKLKENYTPVVSEFEDLVDELKDVADNAGDLVNQLSKIDKAFLELSKQIEDLKKLDNKLEAAVKKELDKMGGVWLKILEDLLPTILRMIVIIFIESIKIAWRLLNAANPNAKYLLFLVMLYFASPALPILMQIINVMSFFMSPFYIIAFFITIITLLVFNLEKIFKWITFKYIEIVSDIDYVALGKEFYKMIEPLAKDLIKLFK